MGLPPKAGGSDALVDLEVVDHAVEAVAQCGGGGPAVGGGGEGDVGLALQGVAVSFGWERHGDDLAGGAGELDDVFGEFAHGEFVGVADVDGAGDGSVEDVEESGGFVEDVAEAPGLCAVAVEGDGLVAEGLEDEGVDGVRRRVACVRRRC